MIRARVSAFCVFALLVLRAVMAAQLPLSADEAYYWLWSLHPAAGYFDHPPMIAWLIRAGTMLFGDTPFGVRFAGVLLSLPASWFVWRAAALILKDQDRAGLAVLFFNLTLMASVALLAATPDMPSIVTSAAFVYFLARVQQTGDGRAWLGAGIAAGLGLLSKYSTLFLGAGTLAWLILDRDARKWLLSPWPYLSAVLALAIFLPNLVWQSQHHWQTVLFQFGRIGAGQFTLRFVGEFAAAQFGLASPLVLLLMAAGLWRATRLGNDRLMLAILIWMGLGFFFQHALHDRVQGNWPCFLYPALAILAADAFAGSGLVWRKLSIFAAPLAAVLLLTVYLLAAWTPDIKGLKNPLARILGREFAPIGEVVAALVKAHLADAVLTTDYQTTAWLRFNYPGMTVVQLNEPQRYPDAPPADASLLARPLIYLAELRRDQHVLVQKFFGYTGFPTQLQTPSSLYMIYPVGRPKSSPLGRMP
ncbi:MAG TPA: glycosyltransferase family 39 protein [Rhizomicrobium sp.]|nr:glycosyltransferase family 39 protein [Rhizomicrobium sp.]